MVAPIRRAWDACMQYGDVRRLRPLTLVRAWHSDRTSQRVALQTLQTRRTVLVLGGNRSGKTYLMRAALVALILGSDHPDARLFWRHNGCDPDAFPRGPGRGWIVALDSNASLEYHRPQIVDLLPKWGPVHPDSQDGSCIASWNMRSQGEARLEIMVPGYDERACIVFKSDKPGKDSMQGSACRAILHDEESQLHGADTWDEADTRLWDQDGWHLMSNTPIQGRTWVYHRFVATGVQDPTREAVVRIYSEDNPFTSKKRLKTLQASGSALSRAKLYGDFVVLEGRCWPTFDQATHVVPSFELPADSVMRARSIDFGTRNPFACLWLTLTKRAIPIPGTDRAIPDGSVVVYREHYRAEQTLAWHVQAIRAAEREGETISITWADPEDAQQVLQLRRDHQIAALKANKAVEAGIDKVLEYMEPHHVDSLPRLYVMDCCPHTIREVEGYRWADGTRVKDQPNRPLKRDDHTCDALRYGVMGFDQLRLMV